MRYARKHELLIYVVGVFGFLALLLAGSFHRPGEVWLREAALAWFLGFGLVRCVALVTMGRKGTNDAEPSSIYESGATSSGLTGKVAPTSAQDGRPWG